MGITLSGGKFVLDKESESKILEIAIENLKNKHANEYNASLEKFKQIVYLQEVARYKKYLETRHPEQVNQIYDLRAILNHERGS